MPLAFANLRASGRFETTIKGLEMNRDQVKGRVKEAAGKVEKIVGRAVDSPKTEAKGIAKEIAGKVQKAVGDVRNDLKDKS